MSRSALHQHCLSEARKQPYVDSQTTQNVVLRVLVVLFHTFERGLTTLRIILQGKSPRFSVRTVSGGIESLEYAMEPCHIILSPGFTGHYQDLDMSSLKRHESACNLIPSVGTLLSRYQMNTQWHARKGDQSNHPGGRCDRSTTSAFRLLS